VTGPLGVAFWCVVGVAAWCVVAAAVAVLLVGWRNVLSLFVPGIAANCDDPRRDRPVPPGCEMEGE
jgi:hypothetical protein